MSFSFESRCNLLKSLVALLGRLTLDQLRNFDPPFLRRNTCRYLLHPILHLPLLLGGPDNNRVPRSSRFIFFDHRGSRYFVLNWNFYHSRFTFLYVDLNLLHLDFLSLLTFLLCVHLSLLCNFLSFLYALFLRFAADEERNRLPTVFRARWELYYAFDEQSYFIFGPPGVNIHFLGLLLGLLYDLFETLLLWHHVRGDEVDENRLLLTRLEEVDDWAQFLDVLVAFRYWLNPKTVILRPLKLLWTEFQQLFHFGFVRQCHLSSLLFLCIFCILLGFQLTVLSFLDLTFQLLTLAGFLCFELLFLVFFSLLFSFFLLVHSADSWIIVVCHLCKFYESLALFFIVLGPDLFVFLLHVAFLVSVTGLLKVVLVILWEFAPRLKVIPILVES